MRNLASAGLVILGVCLFVSVPLWRAWRGELLTPPELVLFSATGLVLTGSVLAAL